MMVTKLLLMKEDKVKQESNLPNLSKINIIVVDLPRA